MVQESLQDLADMEDVIFERMGINQDVIDIRDDVFAKNVP